MFNCRIFYLSSFRHSCRVKGIIMPRAIVIVIDSFGIGHAPDAEAFGDVGANTFASLSQAYYEHTQKPISLPNFSKLGLVRACEEASGKELPVERVAPAHGAYGYCAELSTGKDTPSGHWEMMGVPVLFDWGYFSDRENSFPTALIDDINERTGFKGILGNCHASGTTIINELASEHIKTGIPICYTSADSVFQVAAHEEHFGLDNLYLYCETVREALKGYNVGRVIARPFIGNETEGFERTGNRRDYSVLPPAPTVLDKAFDKGVHVVSVGKISDIFAHQGISEKTKATGINALVDATISHMKEKHDNAIIFTNLVNFDQDFGHRRDAVGYADALQSLDKRLPELYEALNDDDLLIFTADHGCDPTWHGNDHTREFVPVLGYHNHISSVALGQRTTFADMGQTIAELFDLGTMEYGQSFLNKLSMNQI